MKHASGLTHTLFAWCVDENLACFGSVAIIVIPPTPSYSRRYTPVDAPYRSTAAQLAWPPWDLLFHMAMEKKACSSSCHSPARLSSPGSLVHKHTFPKNKVTLLHKHTVINPGNSTLECGLCSWPFVWDRIHSSKMFFSSWLSVRDQNHLGGGRSLFPLTLYSLSPMEAKHGAWSRKHGVVTGLFSGLCPATFIPQPGPPI